LSDSISHTTALIEGVPLAQLPQDLYIHPAALKVFLERFEGPLDLLLYLIQKHNFNILDIPIAEITRQYVQYIELMQELELDLAGEYLVMAAMLTEIKSRMLLPVQTKEPANVSDPREKLLQQLKEYARYKQAARNLAMLPRMERDWLPVAIEPPELPKEIIIPRIPLKALLLAMRDVMLRADLFSSHHITREPLSVRERMSLILEVLKQTASINFISLFTIEEGRAGVVVTLLAMLELARERLIEIEQLEAFGQITIKLSTVSE
jgi:segregation and condensation protein A